jgi:hypothetical protein
MKHLKLFESFNQDKKIEKVNDFILYFLISSYFEKNTEVIVDSGDDYNYNKKQDTSLCSMQQFYVKGTKMKKSVLDAMLRCETRIKGNPDTVYLLLNPDFFHKRLKRYLGKFLGDQYFLEWGDPPRMSALRMTINSIKKYCLKKLNISNMLCILEIE